MAHALIQLRTWLSAKLPGMRDERGAAVVEYALLVAFIFAVLVIAVNVIGGTTSNGLDDAGSSGFVSP